MDYLYSRLGRLERAGQLRLRTSLEDTVFRGRRHDRLDQYHNGVRVFGGDVTRETDGSVTLFVSGNLHTGIDIDTTPVLTAAQAVALVERLAGGTRLASAPAELVILPREDGTFALTWRVTVLAPHGVPIVFVNARTGAEELRLDHMKRQSSPQQAIGLGRGVLGDEKKMSAASLGGRFVAIDLARPWPIRTHDLKGDFARTVKAVDGEIALADSDLAEDTDNTWEDGAVVDAHTHLGWSMDYLYSRLGRRGIADRLGGPTLQGIVHPVRRADLPVLPWAEAGSYFLNAFYCGGCAANGLDIIMLGEGLPPGYYTVPAGQYVDYYAASLDIVAHELAHGVNDYTSNLIYRNESGALSEAFSDIVGISTEFFFPGQTRALGQANYLIGERSYRPYRPGSIAGSRSAADPGLFDDPDHYSTRYVGTQDGGGVHTNCTIATHAFYLAIEGGTNRTSGMAVQGVGAANRAQIETAFYRGLSVMVPSRATFSQASAAPIQAARG
jgi:thermolysin